MADITVFNDHLSDPDDVVARLQPFDVLCVMRERTPLPREIIERLPRLKMIASTGPGNASIDEQAARERNIHLTNTGYRSTPTIELTWALILASARNLVGEATSLRASGWQTLIGRELSGRVLGVLGLGRIGSEIARIGAVFGMELIAWSQNLTAEHARAAGAQWVPQRRTVPPLRCPHHPPGAQRPDTRSGERCRPRRDEADIVAGQHIARRDRRRERSDRRAHIRIDSGRSARRVRHRAPPRWPAATHAGKRRGDPAYRLRRQGPLPNLLPRRGGEHRSMATARHALEGSLLVSSTSTR